MKQVDKVFEKVFKIAKENISINDFSKALMNNDLKGGYCPRD